MRKREGIVLGVDGGGTSTRAALVGAGGKLLGVGRGGPSNYHAVGVEGTRNALATTVAEAWRDAGMEQRICGSAFLGMAGVIGSRDAEVVRALAGELQLAEVIGVDHDIRTALAGGVGADEGIALIAGTGSSCYGRRADGRSHRAGGWGKLFDDAGGAYRIALDGLDAATRALDGRGPETALVERLLAALNVSDPDELPSALVGEAGTHSAVASLAPLVLAAAEEEDAVASAIINSNADQLALMVEAVASRLGWLGSREAPPLRLVAVGGTLSVLFYRSRVVERITHRLGHNPLTDTLMPPTLGAVLLALGALEPVPASVRERLVESTADLRLR